MVLAAGWHHAMRHGVRELNEAQEKKYQVRRSSGGAAYACWRSCRAVNRAGSPIVKAARRAATSMNGHLGRQFARRHGHRTEGAPPGLTASRSVGQRIGDGSARRSRAPFAKRDPRIALTATCIPRGERLYKGLGGSKGVSDVSSSWTRQLWASWAPTARARPRS